MDGRAVEGTGLENQRRATAQGFESLSIRFYKTGGVYRFCNAKGVITGEEKF